MNYLGSKHERLGRSFSQSMFTLSDEKKPFTYSPNFYPSLARSSAFCSKLGVTPAHCSDTTLISWI